MKKMVLFVVLAMIVTIAVGCSDVSSSPNESESSEAEVKDTLTIATTYDVKTFSRMSDFTGSDLRVIKNIFEPLVISEEGEILSGLAENWSVSEDGLNYTFNLRKDVEFSNGDELKASDVVFTFKKYMESEYTETNFSSVKDVTAVDDYTVNVTHSTPNAPFLSMTVSEMPIISEKVWDESGGSVEGYNKNPVGTGPYILSEHNIGQNIVLERNENYWGTKPTIKTVIFEVIQDPNTAVVSLQAGDIDVLYYPPAASISTLNEDPNLIVHDFIENELKSVFINVSAKPLDDVKVRQALSYAIDKESIIQIAGNDNGVKADVLATPNVFGYSGNIKGYDYDVEKAKELLATAGYANGFTVNIMTLPGVYSSIAEVLQQQFSAVGVTAEIQTIDKNAYVEALISGDYQIASFGVDMAPDMDFWSQLLEEGAGRNITRYASSEVTNMFKEARETIDSNERLQIYEKMLQTLKEDAPLIPLYYSQGHIFTHKDLTLGYIDTQSIFLAADANWN